MTRGLGIDEIEIETVGLLSVDSLFFRSETPLGSVLRPAPLRPGGGGAEAAGAVSGRGFRPAGNSQRDAHSPQRGTRSPCVWTAHGRCHARASSTKFAI